MAVATDTPPSSRRRAASRSGGFMPPECSCCEGAGRARLGYVDKPLAGVVSVPVGVLRLKVPVVHLVEQFAAPSMLSVRRISQWFFQRYMPVSGTRRHISFRSVGEQQLTTRIQPSRSDAPASPTGDQASCGQDHRPDGKHGGCQEHGPAWATLINRQLLAG